jgi:NitT/TauT family transport system ATP-binding protein
MTGHADAEAPRAVAEPGVASAIELPLPHVGVGGLAGLLEILNARGGRDDLPELAELLSFEVDDLLPITDAAEMLGFAEVDNADLQLTAVGKEWVEADILTSKQIFARQARQRAPLVRSILRALEATKDGTLNERFFMDLLGRGFTEDQARAQLDTAIDWGRYGELFEYDANDAQLVLPIGEPSPTPRRSGDDARRLIS